MREWIYCFRSSVKWLKGSRCICKANKKNIVSCEVGHRRFALKLVINFASLLHVYRRGIHLGNRWIHCKEHLKYFPMAENFLPFLFINWNGFMVEAALKGNASFELCLFVCDLSNLH